MGTITPDLSGIVDGQVADAVDFTNPLNTITNEINGGLDSDNLADNAVTTAKITAANVTTAKLETELQHGWQDPSDTWSYASATTINVASGAASIYSVGDKIRFKQTAGTYVYFYVTAVADTVLTLTGGSDYTVANEAITANYYSKSSSPVGFPGWFNLNATTKLYMDGRKATITNWGFGLGNGSDAYVGAIVTHGMTFAAIPIVSMTYAGYKDGSDPTTPGDGSAGTVAYVSTYGTTVTAVPWVMTTGSAIGATRRLLYTMTIIGKI